MSRTDRDWFAQAFGAAVADVRRALIEEGWFGRAERPDPAASYDRVLNEKLYPDRGAERGFLGWLEADHARDRRSEPPAPQHDHDFER